MIVMSGLFVLYVLVTPNIGRHTTWRMSASFIILLEDRLLSNIGFTPRGSMAAMTRACASATRRIDMCGYTAVPEDLCTECMR